jgi:molybdopterin-guanine dinucleotide biosynthesis protein A
MSSDGLPATNESVGPLGVILAGGASTRMGSDKALVEVDGEPMIERVARTLNLVCEDLLVVGRHGVLAGVPCVPDDHPGRLGPAAGVATALRAAAGRAVLVVAVDQPFVRVETLRFLAAMEQTTVPRDEVLQITCALFTSEVFGAITAAVDDRVPLWKVVRDKARIVDESEWRSWGEDGRSWFSVDTPASLVEGLKLFG